MCIWFDATFIVRGQCIYNVLCDCKFQIVLQHLFNLFAKSTMGSTVELNNILREFEALVPFSIPVSLGTLSLLFLYFIKGLIFAQKKGYAKLPPVPGIYYEFFAFIDDYILIIMDRICPRKNRFVREGCPIALISLFMFLNKNDILGS